MIKGEESLMGQEVQTDDSLFSRTIPVWMQPLAALGWLLPTQVYSDTLRWELSQAGYRHMEARRMFAGVRVLTTVTLALATVLIGLERHPRPDQRLLLAVTATALGYLH